MANIIDGRAIAAKLRGEFRSRLEKVRVENGIAPGLAVALVGDNPASQVYVRMKEKACIETGIKSFIHRMDKGTSEEELLYLIDHLNRNPEVQGILVQLPLPEGISEEKVLEAIDPAKDVDGFHPYNMGRLFSGNPLFIPCTPHGIIKLLEESDIKIEGKEAVVVGRSAIVGKPVALLLLQKNATVTVCHSRTRDLPSVIKRADILVVAMGREKAIKGDFIKEGAVVIDVGVNRLEDGSLCGDVEFEEAKKRASYITPVPGGVGPMTITMLLHNTILAAEKNLCVSG